MPSPKKPVKWSQSEIEDIMSIIDCGLSYGLPTESIVTDLCDHFSKMSRPMAVSWINRRRNEIGVSKIQLAQDEDLNRGIQLMRLESVYALAMERGDLKSALAAAKELGLTQGLYIDAPKGKSASTKNVHVENMQVLGIPEAALDGLGELSDEQLTRSWKNGEFTEAQAAFLVDASRGKTKEEEP